MNQIEPSGLGTIELQPFERGRRSLLAAPMILAPGVQVVLELFDKHRKGGTPASRTELIPFYPEQFTEEDRRLVAAAADFGVKMLQQALSEQQAQGVLFDALDAALGASDSVAESLRSNAAQRKEEPPAPAILDRLREGLASVSTSVADANETLHLVEAIRVLTLRHGPAAVEHCIRHVESLRQMLDAITGTGEVRA